MKIILTENQLNRLINESATKNEVYSFFNEFGFMISLNFTHIVSRAIDKESGHHLRSMLDRLSEPIINGKTYFELLDNFNEIVRNPKYLSAFLLQTKKMIEFIEPRIEKYVSDSDFKVVILKKIHKLKEQYINIIS